MPKVHRAKVIRGRVVKAAGDVTEFVGALVVVAAGVMLILLLLLLGVGSAENLADVGVADDNEARAAVLAADSTDPDAGGIVGTGLPERDGSQPRSCRRPAIPQRGVSLDEPTYVSTPTTTASGAPQ